MKIRGELREIIADEALGLYRAAMRALAIRLLALIAVLVMPLGMSAVPAVAHEAHPAAGMAMPHCPDQPAKHDAKGAFAECTMACSAALPAIDGAGPRGPLIECVPVDCPAVQRLSGLHPDTATPPPKRS